MLEGYKLEIPDFAAAWRQGIACDINSGCNDCCEIASDPNCRLNFGLDTPNGPNNPIANCVCHDVCVQEVTMISSQEVHATIPYPPVGRCRLGPGVTLPAIIPGAVANLFVTCAGEALGATCTSVCNTIGLLAIVPTLTGTVIALPLQITLTFSTFFDFPTCAPLTPTQVATRMKEIDGSCKIIQLRAVVNATGDAILIDGKVVDKLWQHQNLWFVGVRPFDLNDAERNLGFISITVDNVFTNCLQQINPCTPANTPTCAVCT